MNQTYLSSIPPTSSFAYKSLYTFIFITYYYKGLNSDTLVSDIQTTVNTSGYTQLGNTFRFAIIDAKNVRYLLWKEALYYY